MLELFFNIFLRGVLECRLAPWCTEIIGLTLVLRRYRFLFIDLHYTNRIFLQWDHLLPEKLRRFHRFSLLSSLPPAGKSKDHDTYTHPPQNSTGENVPLNPGFEIHCHWIWRVFYAQIMVCKTGLATLKFPWKK